MCVDCVLASLRIVQVDSGDEPASFGVSVTPVPYVVIIRSLERYVVHFVCSL
jgi:hypothetical protein